MSAADIQILMDLYQNAEDQESIALKYIKKALKMIAESGDGIFRAAVRVQNSDIVRWLPQSLVINEAARMRRSGKRSSVDG